MRQIGGGMTASPQSKQARRVKRGEVRLLAVIVGLLLTQETVPAHAYRTLAELEGESVPIVWSFPPVVALSDSTIPALELPMFIRETDFATRAWNSTGCAGELISFGPESPVPSVVVRVERAWAVAGFDEGAVATTDLVLESSDAGVRIVNATIHVNGELEWASHDAVPDPNVRDLRAALVHELGHVLGLAHVCEADDPRLPCETEHVGTVMHPAYELGGGVRLSADDLSGACDLYRPTAPPSESCDSSDECFDGESCSGNVCVLDPDFGVACTDRSECASTYCIVDEASPLGGTCTHECAADDECPSNTNCIGLMGTARRVCVAARAEPTCSASPGVHTRSGHLPTIVFALAALLIVRRNNRVTHQ